MILGGSADLFWVESSGPKCFVGYVQVLSDEATTTLKNFSLAEPTLLIWC